MINNTAQYEILTSIMDSPGPLLIFMKETAASHSSEPVTAHLSYLSEAVTQQVPCIL
jgi:hypothetical protein